MADQLTEAEELELRALWGDWPDGAVVRLFATLDVARAETQRMREALETANRWMTYYSSMTLESRVCQAVDVIRAALAPERSRSDV